MSRIKEELDRAEGLFQTAQGIAVEAGAIIECEHHPGTYLSCDNAEANNKAYAFGTNKIKTGKLDLKRQELMDAIKSAIDDAGDECYSCEKWKRG